MRERAAETFVNFQMFESALGTIVPQHHFSKPPSLPVQKSGLIMQVSDRPLVLNLTTSLSNSFSTQLEIIQANGGP